MKTFDSIGFIGGGRVTRFLLEGWKAAGQWPKIIHVADCNPQVLDALAADFPEIVRATTAQAAGCGVVVLAVHPPAMKEAMEAVKPHLAPDALALSLVPKFTAAAIAAALGMERVVRMIPNAPSAIGKGFNPVAFGPGVDAAAKAGLQTLFAPWGAAPEVPEADLEAYAILSAMGPTYLWFQWQTLRELAASTGVAGHVIFTGSVPYDELPDHYNAATVFAMPARTRGRGLDVEGLGIVYLEAQACGVPVIAGDSGGAPETVTPETGIVVDGRREDELATALLTLLDDPQLAADMGQAGRRYARTEWSWDIMGARLRDILR